MLALEILVETLPGSIGWVIHTRHGEQIVLLFTDEPMMADVARHLGLLLEKVKVQ